MSKPYELPGGAQRSTQAPAFHLLRAVGLRRLARRFQLGATAYGDKNWLRSLERESDAAVFCREAFNHLMEHALKCSNGEEPFDDHLAAIMWGAQAIMEAEDKFKKRWIELCK